MVNRILPSNFPQPNITTGILGPAHASKRNLQRFGLPGNRQRRPGHALGALRDSFTALRGFTGTGRIALFRFLAPSLRRLGQPEEIARWVVFFAADESGFITGSTLTANGGQYMA
jgi:NAD(P)-dependent dehydrogenase (short-subunit alcohol dehydrogenase family)